MIIEIPAHVIRGAMICQATKDVRTYLNAIVFNGDTGEVVGSDGHILFVAEVEGLQGTFPSYRILQIPQKLPKAIDSVDFDTEENTIFLKKYSYNDETDKCEVMRTGAQLNCKFMDDTYPNYGELLPNDDTPVTNILGLNPALVKRAINAIEISNGAGLIWQHFENSALVTANDDTYKRKVMIMCMGLSKDEN